MEIPLKMKAVVITEAEKAEVLNLHTPVPAAGEVLIKVEKALICTWEQRIFTGKDTALPFVPGHEVSGTVALIPEGTVTSLKRGDKVVVKTLDACGQCEACQRGNDNQCKGASKKRSYDGIPGSGGFAQYMAIGAERIFTLPDQTCDLALAAFAEPVACCLRSLEQAHLEMSEDVVIVGGGIMGQLLNILAKKQGARTLFVEPDAGRRELAEEMGADIIIDPGAANPIDKIREATNGFGAHVVLYTINVLSLAETYIDALRNMGRMVYYGSFHPSGNIGIDPNKIHYSEKMITGSYSPKTQGFWIASRLLSYGLIDVKPFLTETYGIADCQTALKRALSQETYRVCIDLWEGQKGEGI